MKEILKYIGLTLIFFMVYSCSGGEDILQEGPEEDPFKDYCLVTIEHSGKSFGFLEFTGSKLSGNKIRKSTRLNSSHIQKSRMPSSA